MLWRWPAECFDVDDVYDHNDVADYDDDDDDDDDDMMMMMMVSRGWSRSSKW